MSTLLLVAGMALLVVAFWRNRGSFFWNSSGGPWAAAAVVSIVLAG